MDRTAKKRAVFARLSSRPIPRIERMMTIAAQQGFDPVFLAARRASSLPSHSTECGHNVHRIGPYFPLLNGTRPGLYIRSVFGYNWALWKSLRHMKPDIVHASDMETMPASIAYKIISRCRLIYNIHDNLAQRYAAPWALRVVMNALEGIAVLCASTTLVPEEFRRDALPKWCRRHVRVVRNTPANTDPQKARNTPPKPKPPIRIFFGGWLDRGRGLDALLELVRENSDFELTIAGEGDPQILDRARTHPRTRFLGFIPHKDIMKETERCHFVWAVYDPARPINRYAASNKLAESLACRRPPLVNSEMLITRDFQDHDCLVSLPYADIPARAAETLRALIVDNPEVYRTKSDTARRAYDALYSWDTAQAAMLAALES